MLFRGALYKALTFLVKGNDLLNLGILKIKKNIALVVHIFRFNLWLHCIKDIERSIV